MCMCWPTNICGNIGRPSRVATSGFGDHFVGNKVTEDMVFAFRDI